MNPIWITVFLSTVVAIRGVVSSFMRATMTGANFFTHRYRLVLQAREERLDIAEQLAYLGQEGAAQAQIDAANELVARAIILTETVEERRGIRQAAGFSYGVFVLTAGALILSSFLPQGCVRTALGAVGAVGMVITAIGVLVLGHLSDKADKHASLQAPARAAQFTNPSSYQGSRTQ